GPLGCRGPLLKEFEYAVVQTSRSCPRNFASIAAAGPVAPSAVPGERRPLRRACRLLPVFAHATAHPRHLRSRLVSETARLNPRRPPDGRHARAHRLL